MEWTDQERIVTLQSALSMIPHNQMAVGIGFKLTHNLERCMRCRAEIALLEISGKLNMEVMENVP